MQPYLPYLQSPSCNVQYGTSTCCRQASVAEQVVQVCVAIVTRQRPATSAEARVHLAAALLGGHACGQLPRSAIALL